MTVNLAALKDYLVRLETLHANSPVLTVFTPASGQAPEETGPPTEAARCARIAGPHCRVWTSATEDSGMNRKRKLESVVHWLTSTFFLHMHKKEAAMALNIKNSAVERLVEEVARLSGESKTEAVRRALEERKAKLVYRVACDPRR